MTKNFSNEPLPYAMTIKHDDLNLADADDRAIFRTRVADTFANMSFDGIVDCAKELNAARFVEVGGETLRARAPVLRWIADEVIASTAGRKA